MKLGFVANSHGNLALLEEVMLMLVERHRVDRIVPVESAVYDADAVQRGRRQRFPAEVAWTDPSYADFVLASVLQGVVEAPDAELQRNAQLAERVATEGERSAGFGSGLRRVALAGTPGAKSAGVVVRANPERRGVTRGNGAVLLTPGHLRGRDFTGEGASCALVELNDGKLTAHFLDVDGEAVSPPINLEAMG
jgi:hypothetical protein